MDFSAIVDRLRSDNLPEVSKATGIPRETLRRIATGMTPGPRIVTVQRIAAYYRNRRKQQVAA